MSSPCLLYCKAPQNVFVSKWLSEHQPSHIYLFPNLTQGGVATGGQGGGHRTVMEVGINVEAKHTNDLWKFQVFLLAK